MTARRAFLAVAALAALGAGLAFAQAGWIAAKAWAANGLIDRAWTRTLAGGGPAAPWPWADTAPVAVLEVPRLGLRRVVLEGADGRALAFGPVMRAGGGPAVVFGHRDTHFRALRALSAGDAIRLTRADGRAGAYRVVETAVLHRDALALPADLADALLLVTCYPFDAVRPDTPWRFAVLALPDKVNRAAWP